MTTGIVSSKEETLRDLELMFPSKIVHALSYHKALYARVKKYLGDGNLKETIETYGFEYDTKPVPKRTNKTKGDVEFILLGKFPDRNLNGLWTKDKNLYELVRRTFGNDCYREELKKRGFRWMRYSSSEQETLKDLELKFPGRVVRGLAEYEALYGRVRKYLWKGNLVETLDAYGFEHGTNHKWSRKKVMLTLWREYPDGVIKDLSYRQDLYGAVQLHIGRRYRIALKKEGFTFTKERITKRHIKQHLRKEFPDKIIVSIPRGPLRSRIDRYLGKHPTRPFSRFIEELGFEYCPEPWNKGKSGFTYDYLANLARSTYPSGVAVRLTENEWLYATVRRTFGNMRKFLEMNQISYKPYEKQEKAR